MCDSISEKIYLGLDIDVDIFKELENRSVEYDLPLGYIIQNYIRIGLKKDNEGDTMAMVNINKNVMEKVNIKCKLSNKTPEEVINEALWDRFRKLEDISEDFDAEKIWNMLDHDKPEGDGILDRITDMFE